MFMDTASVAQLCRASDKEQQQLLKNHFDLFYITLAEHKFVPNASFEMMSGMRRGLSGMLSQFHNAVIGVPSGNDEAAFIDVQVNYFKDAKVPFVWYVDEGENKGFEQKLLNQHFLYGGVFQGVFGFLDKPISDPVIPEGCGLELVKDEAGMDEFNDLVCATFGINDAIVKQQYKQVLWNAAKNQVHPMFHWIARKQGNVVATLTAFIEGELVSFWNGATVPDLRRQGLSTALLQLALKDAIARGCKFAASYLMAEALALGICTKLGFETKWRFNVYTAPVSA